MKNGSQNIVVFDGTCNFCSAWMKLLLKADAKHRLQFAASQSSSGQKLMEEFKLKEIEDTIYFIQDGKVLNRSRAIFGILSVLGWIYKPLLIFKILGVGLNDKIYKWVANNRYRFFGKSDACFVPSPEMRAQFMD